MQYSGLDQSNSVAANFPAWPAATTILLAVLCAIGVLAIIFLKITERKGSRVSERNPTNSNEVLRPRRDQAECFGEISSQV
jgi:hypothetical protein